MKLERDMRIFTQKKILVLAVLGALLCASTTPVRVFADDD